MIKFVLCTIACLSGLFGSQVFFHLSHKVDVQGSDNASISNENHEEYNSYESHHFEKAPLVITKFQLSLECLGRKFDGVGAISGGGATSKLLRSYQEPWRSRVLDYLFQPGYGASLQILKVEIGGDSQSTEGTESSHMHTPWDEDYTRGYEWWLMKEAKARNPAIKLYGLSWGFPAWLSGDSWWPYHQPHQLSMYIIQWISAAHRIHNLTIDYIGVWNEKPYSAYFLKVFRRELDSAGLPHVQIVAADEIGVDTWNIASRMKWDMKLADAVDIIGGHYTESHSSADAQSIKKPLWSSEDYSAQATDHGAACIARLINRNYVIGQMTSTIAWNMISSYYDNLPIGRQSLMIANQPWSGYYQVSPPIWAVAHTTHFTAPTWRYLAHGSGVGYLYNDTGTYITMVSPQHNDVTMVIENINPKKHSACMRHFPPYSTQAVNATFVLDDSLSHITTLHHWSTKLMFNNESTYFQYMGEVHVTASRELSVYIAEDTIHTLTTVQPYTHIHYTAQRMHTDHFVHDTHTSYKTVHEMHKQDVPLQQPYPLPYSENFDDTAVGQEGEYLAQQVGSFEVQLYSELCSVLLHQRHISQHAELHQFTYSNNKQTMEDSCMNDTHYNKVLQQMVQQAPIHWCPTTLAQPITVFGDYQWSVVGFELDGMIPSVNGSSGIFIALHVNNSGCTTFWARGLYFFVLPAENKLLIASDLARTEVLYSRHFTLLYNVWYHLTLIVHQDGCFVAKLDSVVVYEGHVTEASHGFAGFGSDSFGFALYDNIHVFPVDDVIPQH